MTEVSSQKQSLRHINVLMVEDNPADVELCVRELKKAGFDPQVDVNQTSHEFAASITAKSYDVILADYSLPAWNGFQALELLQQMNKEVPFLLVTGTLDDQAAVEFIQKGGADYIHKDRLARLPVAVQRALERKVLREEAAQSGSRNASDRQRVEEAITSLAAFAQRNPNPVLEFTRDGKLTYFNEAAREMAKSLGKEHPLAMLPAEISSVVQTCLTTGQKKLRIESSLSGRTLSWSFFPVKPNQVVHCYVNDITDRLNLEAQLRHSQKLESVGRLAAGVAHDFNNILTVIQGHTGLLRSEPNLSAEMKESIQQVSRAAQRASKLTNQLLTFSRKTPIQPRRIDLNETLTNMSMLLHRTLGEDITFQFNYAADLPPVWADPGLIEQVIMNLAVNAREAMPRGGQLVISTAVLDIDRVYIERHPEGRVGRFVCLTMIDTGRGMDQNTLSRLFEPFFTTKEPSKGAGLGLATAYGIVKQHQGWIEVQSRLGQGSTMRVYLPPSDRALEEQAGAPLSTAIRGGTEMILAVEDEPPVLWTIRNVLERYGYRVLEAATGVEALAIWHQHQNEIALLLTDMVMPVGLNGQELADKFKSQKPNLKVIYTSGYSVEVAGKDLALMDGLNFLQKPFDSEKLASAVRKCLDS